jgi:hypothetical protein
VHPLVLIDQIRKFRGHWRTESWTQACHKRIADSLDANCNAVETTAVHLVSCRCVTNRQHRQSQLTQSPRHRTVELTPSNSHRLGYSNRVATFNLLALSRLPHGLDLPHNRLPP